MIVKDEISTGLRDVTLDGWMSARRMTDGEMADRIGVSREYVRLLRAGRRTASRDVARRIRKATQDAVDGMENDDGAMGKI